jgi:hypothetical protein
MVVNELRLPEHTTALRWFVASFDALSVGIGANQYDEIGFLKLTVHPHWPAIWRGCIVLIKYGVNAVLPETVCQSSNAVFMGTRIMTVADEDSRCRLAYCLRSHSKDMLRAIIEP